MPESVRSNGRQKQQTSSSDPSAKWGNVTGRLDSKASCYSKLGGRRFDLHEATGSPIAHEALARIGALYAIEAEIRGHSPDERRSARAERTAPLLTELREFLLATMRKVSKKSDLGGAIHYTLAQWDALCRFARDGRIEIDNNAAERALRAVVVERSLCTSLSSV